MPLTTVINIASGIEIINMLQSEKGLGDKVLIRYAKFIEVNIKEEILEEAILSDTEKKVIDGVFKS